MSQELKVSKSKWSDLTNLIIRNSNNSDTQVNNLICEDVNGNQIGIWSRYKTISTWKSYAIPAIAFSTKTHAPWGDDLSEEDICFRGSSSKIDIPYKNYYRLDSTGTRMNNHYHTYIFPIWYIPDDTKYRILTSLQNGGGNVNNYIKWPNYKDVNGVRCYAYTKIWSGVKAGNAGGRRNNQQFPSRGPLTYNKETHNNVGPYTKSYRYCGANIDPIVSGQNIDKVNFRTEMDKYNANYGSPVTLTISSSYWSNVKLKIDYLNRYGAQVTETITANKTLTIMVGSIVYLTPCLVNNTTNLRSGYARAVVANNSISSPTSFSDNPTIRCGLLEDKVNLENNYPNSFRIVKNCNLTLSRTNTTGTKNTGSFYTLNGRWSSTPYTFAETTYYTSLDYTKSTDSSFFPSTDYNRCSAGTYNFWPSTGNTISSKYNAAPSSAKQYTLDYHPNGGICEVEFTYNANGFIRQMNMYQSTGGARTINYNFFFN